MHESQRSRPRKWGPPRVVITVIAVYAVVVSSLLMYVLFIMPSSDAVSLEQIRDIALIVGGGTALLFAGWRSWVAERQADIALRQSEVSQRRLLDERYQRAAEMLGSTVIATRLGGIYALDRLVEDDTQRYYPDALRLWTAVIRHPTEDADAKDYDWLRDDVQAALDAIGRRNDPDDLERISAMSLESDALFHHERAIVVLQGVMLSKARLIAGNFRKVFFVDADLSGLRAQDSDFTGAFLTRATLAEAELKNVDLSQAHLVGANLTDARFIGSNLSGARLRSTDVSGVDFSGEGKFPVSGLTQRQLDQAKSNPHKPPNLEGVEDAFTGRPLIWRGDSLDR